MAGDIGYAIKALKTKNRVAREDWDGDYITLLPGYPDGIEANENIQKAHRVPAGTIMKYKPYIQKFTAQGIAMWSPSTDDMLAEDWVILE
jgi:hypothetical protein